MRREASMLFAVLCLLGATQARAGTWSVAPDPATIGTAAGSVSQTITISFTGDGATQHTQIDYDFDETRFTAQPSAMNGSACVIFTPNANHRVRVAASVNPPFPPTPTALCTVTFTALTANTDTGGAPELTFPTSGEACGNGVGLPVACNAGGPIRLDVQQAPVLAVPTLGPIGKRITMALLAALGLVGFAMRRRVA